MKAILIFIILLISTSASQAKEQFLFMIEGGAVWQNRNDTKISPADGTRIAIDRFDDGPFIHHRLEARYNFSDRHSVRGLYAPLDISVSGSRDSSTNFNDVTFAPSTPLDIRYRFNSYRLSYIYSFWSSSDEILDLGVTAKIRDASTTFSQGSLASNYDNVGFVPLIYFEFQKALTKNLKINLTMDGAIASQGRAVDAALKMRTKVNDQMDFGLGVRTLEGGADNEKVFTFSWFTYVVADIIVRF